MTKQEQLADLTLAIGKNRSSLATALIEDESVRTASEKRSKEYLEKVDEHDTSTPFWMWCTLWYILGMFTIITIDVSLTDALTKLSIWVNDLMLM